MKTLLWAAMLALIGIGGAAAQTYPSRPITIIAPFPPGGPSDALARILVRPLGGGARPADRHRECRRRRRHGRRHPRRARRAGRLHLADRPMEHPGRQPGHLQSDRTTWSNDFAPIALLADTPQMIIARKDFPASDVRELIAWLKANPDKAQAATVGAAGGAQVAGMYFQTGHRHAIRLRALSRRRAGDAGPDGRPRRHHVRPGRQRDHPGARRHHQGLRGHDRTALAPGARHPDHRRVRRAGPARFLLARAVRAEGNTAGHHRQGQCRGGERARRSESAAKLCRSRARISGRASSRRRKRSARSTRPRSTSGGRSSETSTSRRNRSSSCRKCHAIAYSSPWRHFRMNSDIIRYSRTGGMDYHLALSLRGRGKSAIMHASSAANRGIPVGSRGHLATVAKHA